MTALLVGSAAALALSPFILSSSYSWIANTTSEAAAQGMPEAWLARLGFVLLGTGVLWLTLQERTRWGRWGARMHSAFGALMLATAAFSHRPIDSRVPVDVFEDTLHSAAATAMGFAFAAGVAIVAWRRGSHSIGLLDWVAVVASAAIPLAMMVWPGAAGLLQRTMFLIAYAWYLNEARSDPRSADGPEMEASLRPQTRPIGVYLYWLPLGAGGAGFVRWNGRIYEAIQARLGRRKPLDLYHSALEVRLPEDRFTVESAWPSPDADVAARGVVIEGPVFVRRLARFRPFRYEVRCWRDGSIPDEAEAVEIRLVNGREETARRLLELVPTVPPLVWGRDEVDAGDMWNSNSVVSFLLAGSGISAGSIDPPTGGRAPGWEAGINVWSTSGNRRLVRAGNVTPIDSAG